MFSLELWILFKTKNERNMEGTFNLNLDMANCNIPLMIMNSSLYLSYLIFFWAT